MRFLSIRTLAVTALIVGSIGNHAASAATTTVAPVSSLADCVHTLILHILGPR